MKWILTIILLTATLSFSAVTTMLFVTQSSSPNAEENVWITEFQSLGLTVTTEQISNSINIGNKECLAMAYDFGTYHAAIMNVMKAGHPLLILGRAMQTCDDIAIFKMGSYQTFSGGCVYMYKKGDYANILSGYSNDQMIYMHGGGSGSTCLNYYTEFVGAWLSSFWNSSPYNNEVLMGVCDPSAHNFNGNNGYTGKVASQVCVYGHYGTNCTFTSDFTTIFKRVFAWFTYKPTGVEPSSFGNIKALYK